MLAHDADLRLLGEGVFESVGEPVGHGVAHDHDRGRGRGVALALHARSAREIRRASRGAAVHARRRFARVPEPAASERVILPVCVAAVAAGAAGDSPIGPRTARPRASAKPALTQAAAQASASARNAARPCRQELPCERMRNRRSVSHEGRGRRRHSTPSHHRSILRQKCQLEDGPVVTPAENPNGARKRSRIDAEAKPSGTTPTAAWNWRSAARVLPPSRPSGSPTS